MPQSNKLITSFYINSQVNMMITALSQRYNVSKSEVICQLVLAKGRDDGMRPLDQYSCPDYLERSNYQLGSLVAKKLTKDCPEPFLDLASYGEIEGVKSLQLATQDIYLDSHLFVKAKGYLFSDCFMIINTELAHKLGLETISYSIVVKYQDQLYIAPCTRVYAHFDHGKRLSCYSVPAIVLPIEEECILGNRFLVQYFKNHPTKTKLDIEKRRVLTDWS